MEKTKTAEPLCHADLTKLFEVLDAHPFRFGGGKPLTAHLVPVEEDGQVLGEVVELRTPSGSPALVMNRSDYEELRKMEPEDFDLLREIHRGQ